jgi:hypothetical protein
LASIHRIIFHCDEGNERSFAAGDLGVPRRMYHFLLYPPV